MKTNVVIPKRCTYCDEVVDIKVTGDQYLRLQKWSAGEGLIQNLLPDLSADIRKMFISGVCPKCWGDDNE